MPEGANLLATTTRAKRRGGTSNRPLPRLVRHAPSEEGNAASIPILQAAAASDVYSATGLRY